MTSVSQKEQFLSLIQRFLSGKLAAARFCAQFTAAWIQERDETYAKRAAWPQPYDELLMTAWQRGEMRESEFQEKWAKLWGYLEDREFRSLVDEIHSACSVCSPSPGLPWELDEEQLRHAVTVSLANYKRLSEPAVQAV